MFLLLTSLLFLNRPGHPEKAQNITCSYLFIHNQNEHLSISIHIKQKNIILWVKNILDVFEVDDFELKNYTFLTINLCYSLLDSGVC